MNSIQNSLSVVTPYAKPAAEVALAVDGVRRVQYAFARVQPAIKREKFSYDCLSRFNLTRVQHAIVGAAEIAGAVALYFRK